MFARIVTLSPQGQITIPKIIRRNMTGKKYLLEYKNDIVLLKPCRVMIKKKNTESAYVEKILDLTDDQKTVFSLVRQGPCSADFLIQETCLGVRKVNVLLGQLECQELITRNRDFLWVTRDTHF